MTIHTEVRPLLELIADCPGRDEAILLLRVAGVAVHYGDVYALDGRSILYVGQERVEFRSQKLLWKTVRYMHIRDLLRRFP